MVLTTDYEGATGAKVTRRLEKASTGTLEAILASRFPFAAYVELRAWKAAHGAEVFTARPFGDEEQTAPWADIADGIVFVKTEQPGKLPNGP